MKDQFYEMRGSEQREGLEQMIEWINNIRPTSEMSMIEIGSYVGESTLMFSEHFNSVLSIDPYMDDYDVKDEATKYKPFNEVYEQFKTNTQHKNNIKQIRLTSNDAYDILKDELFDLVYIDGNHQYEFVKQDILNYKNLVKPGGYIAGHDYVEHFPGVIQAVEETVGTVDKVFVDSSWIKKL